MKKFCTLFFLFHFVAIKLLMAQNEIDDAHEKAQQAMVLMDKHQYDNAIKILQSARKEDPKNHDYLYQIGLAYYLKQDFTNAILVFSQLIKMSDAKAAYFETYGNVLDDDKQTEKALEIYFSGLKKFPKSGSLYFQIGNIYLAQKKYNPAISAYESGIEAEPAFAPNYYRAAKLYCYSNEEVWGMIYGEIYLNLDHSNKHSAEISKLLYDVYKSEINLTSDSTLTVSFSKQKSSNKSAVIPYGIGVYEPTLELALKGIKSININSLDKVRSKFLEIYFEKGYNKLFPNALFDYQNIVKNAGHFEAYNHWLLYKGNETMFAVWQAKNKEKWEDFIVWYKANALQLNEQNKFYRKKFD